MSVGEALVDLCLTPPPLLIADAQRRLVACHFAADAPAAADHSPGASGESSTAADEPSTISEGAHR
jgi:hypothetical protein